MAAARFAFVARSSPLVGVVAAVLVASAQPALAIAETWQERGRVVGVVDGDTIRVDIWGDGTKTPSRVRFTGMNANEVGRCHGAAATARTTRLALGKFARLYAIDVNSHSGMRLRRTVLTHQPDGSYLNLGRTLVAESLANASPIHDEWGRNAEYRELQDRVMTRHVRLWDRNACGTGPQQPIGIRVKAHWEGGASTEYVDITNTSSTRLGVGGWWVRNTSPSRFVFPSGAAIPGGRTLRLHVGRGTPRGLHYYWGSTVPRFLNPSNDHRAFGNGAFLVDPDGDIRAFDVYP